MTYNYPDPVTDYRDNSDSSLLTDWLNNLPNGTYRVSVLYSSFLAVIDPMGLRMSIKRFSQRCQAYGLAYSRGSAGVRLLTKKPIKTQSVI